MTRISPEIPNSGPVIAPNMTYDYGALSLFSHASLNGFIPLYTGVVTYWGIVGGNSGSHFSINSSTGYISLTNQGDTDNLNYGTYSLTISVTGPDGTSQQSITIRCTGTDVNGFDLSKGYSVGDSTQINTIWGRKASTGLNYGQSIMLRAGFYDDMYLAKSYTDIPGETPSDATFLAVPANQPLKHRGVNVNTGKYLSICGHAGAWPEVERIRRHSNTAGGADYVRIAYIYFKYAYLPGTTPDYTLNSPLEDDFCLSFTSTCQHSLVDHCIFESNPLSQGLCDMRGGVWIANGTHHFFMDNIFRYLHSGINMNYSSGRHGDSFVAVGNTFDTIWTDCLFLWNGSNQVVTWNLMINKKSAYATGMPGNHPDYIQWKDLNGAVSDCTDNLCCYNICVRGNGTPSAQPQPATVTDGSTNYGYATTYDGDDGQIIIAAPLNGFKNKNWLVEGNITVGTISTNRIIVNSFDTCIIRANLCVNHQPADYLRGALTPGRIALYNFNNTNNIIEYNIFETFVDQVSGASSNIWRNNTQVSRTAPQGQAGPIYSYLDVFENPPIGRNDLTPLTSWRVKSTSAAGTASPKHGPHHDYIDWNNRSANFPWYA